MENFTWQSYEAMFKEFLRRGYKIICLKDYFLDKYSSEDRLVVNRIDVDYKIERLKKVYNIFKKLSIQGTIFLRLHSPNYNLFSIGNILIVKELLSLGCEIGIHSELEDLKGYCGVAPQEALQASIKCFEVFFQTKIYGTASHGDMTRYNNLDFWESFSPRDFGLMYEAYEPKLMNNSLYVTDSEWTQWKSYREGELCEGDRRSPIELLEESPKILYLLTHVDCWYDNYIWE